MNDNSKIYKYSSFIKFMEEFKDQVKKGFVACKSDISKLERENLDLRNKINSLIIENKNLKDKFEKINSSQIDLLSQIKGLEIAMNYIKDFNLNKNSNVVENNAIVNKEKISSQDPYEALLAFKAKANKREVLKNKMLSMIVEGGMNLSELKFMFVDHFRYCSKATFYNYLKELESNQEVIIKREKTKNHIYLRNDSILNSV